MPGWDSSCWLATCLVTGGTVLLGKCGQVTNDVISGIFDCRVLVGAVVRASCVIRGWLRMVAKSAARGQETPGQLEWR